MRTLLYGAHRLLDDGDEGDEGQWLSAQLQADIDNFQTADGLDVLEARAIRAERLLFALSLRTSTASPHLFARSTMLRLPKLP